MSSKTNTSPRPVQPGDHVYLVDGSGYIFRAYHALPPLTRKSDGLPVGAVAGFANMLNKLLREMNEDERPTHLAVIFDKSAKTFRNDIFPDYKANRPPPPEDLVPQFGLIRQVTQAFNVPAIEQDGYEADDLIATYARQAAEAGATVRIISSDKDLMQLVKDRTITLYDTMKDREIDEDEVVKKFGVPPNKVVEVQALAGDSVDNIPGVPGIGVKTGAQLIGEYGDVEHLLARAEEIKQPKRRENLIAFADQARLSRRLVRLVDDVPVEVPLEDLAVRAPDPAVLIGTLKGLEFTTLTRRVAGELEADAGEIEPRPVAFTGWPPEGDDGGGGDGGDGGDDDDDGDGELIAAVMKEIAGQPDHDGYELVTEMAVLERWLERASEVGRVCIDTETTSLDAMQAELVGIALSCAPGEGAYIPLAHRPDDGLGLEGEVPAQLPRQDVLDALRPVLADPAILKVGQNLKYDLVVLARCGLEVTPFDDTMLLSYSLDSGRHGHGMDELARTHLDISPIPYSQVAGKGKSAVTFDLVAVDKACGYAAEDADITMRLWKLFRARLAVEKKATVYETLERPLAPVLTRMEMAGITVDRSVLARLSGELAGQARQLEAKAHELAGESFNLGSPKQLGEVLFTRMGLAGGRKTATGAHSTDSQVLEDLAGEGVELARVVLDWRQLAKLKSTYTDALPAHINPHTGRVHTSYAMAATSTGRLASTDPNLQNIPVRTPEGRKIRAAFVAAKGCKLISADYSQIELRVLAHVADIAALKKAFADGLDIHAMTAAEMFDVPIEGMDPQVRRRAKAINFGIIYGISAFGLANQLGIPREEAGEYIRRYFKRFPGIKDYMERTKAWCHDHGYVENIFGRRMHFPRIASPNASERAFQERAAINAPIQSAAADVIRRAMVRMEPALAERGLSAKMLLQVHDELIFEAAEGEVAATIEVARAVMENAAHPAVQLSVPLKVDARAADNWEEAH